MYSLLSTATHTVVNLPGAKGEFTAHLQTVSPRTGGTLKP